MRSAKIKDHAFGIWLEPINVNHILSLMKKIANISYLYYKIRNVFMKDIVYCECCKTFNCPENMKDNRYCNDCSSKIRKGMHISCDPALGKDVLVINGKIRKDKNV